MLERVWGSSEDITFKSGNKEEQRLKCTEKAPELLEVPAGAGMLAPWRLLGRLVHAAADMTLQISVRSTGEYLSGWQSRRQ